MNIFCRTITPQRVGELSKLAPQLKNFYLSDLPYETSTWRSREDAMIFGAGCDLIVRAQAAANELPAHALLLGAAESKNKWAKALAHKDNNILFLWTKGIGLPHAIATALKSRVTYSEDVRQKRGTAFEMVWPETRMALLSALEKGFTLPTWDPILLPAIQAAETVVSELSATREERVALAEAYQRAAAAIRYRASQTTETAANLIAQISQLPSPTSGIAPASQLPTWTEEASGRFPRKPLSDWKSWLMLGGGLLATVGIIFFTRSLQTPR